MFRLVSRRTCARSIQGSCPESLFLIACTQCRFSPRSQCSSHPECHLTFTCQSNSIMTTRRARYKALTPFEPLVGTRWQSSQRFCTRHVDLYNRNSSHLFDEAKARYAASVLCNAYCGRMRRHAEVYFWRCGRGIEDGFLGRLRLSK